MNPDLSILIPARNEESLQRTIADVLAHARGNTEILVALDNWDDAPVIEETDRVRVIRTYAGQRGATNALARLSGARYLMKLDAHCSMADGFDVKLMEDMADDITIVPAIGNLHVYDWVCENGHRHFQGKYDTCEQCGSTTLHKEPVWRIIPRPIRSSFYFDTTMHFQYMPEDDDELVHETMSIQGSCFMVTREKYWELSLCDESFGSWGQQGVEVACKTWLSGGRVLASRKAFYGHQFRESEGFPYLNPSEAIFKAQEHSRELFLGNNWPLQKHSFSWLIAKFGFPGDWTPEELRRLSPPRIA